MRRWLAMVCVCLATVALAAAPEILVLGLFPDKALVRIDGERYVLGVGEGPPGIKLISADSEKAVLEVGGEQKTFTMGSDVGSGFESSGSGDAEDGDVVSIYPDDQGMYRTPGEINGKAVEFLVDTGASMVAMNAQTAELLGIDYKKGKPMTAKTASGVVNAYQVTLNAVSVGSVKVYDVDASVIHGDSPEVVLLGMTFLHNVEIDHEDKAIILKRKW